ncbi:MAG: class I SAM-dependent methyltransferase [Gammaproteobacteria bacterium]|nr:class I SAM-dependent methyltransferase [Gammaproteobacteria bacterium]
MSEAEHWEQIYASRSSRQVGWYAPHLETSIKWIAELDLAPGDTIIDVGAGASTLVDDLLVAGHKKLTVLELTESAIAVSRERLGRASVSVSWLQGDVTQSELPSRHFKLWHDRAVFHFLVDPQQQQKYKDALLGALTVDGHFIIGAFDLEAPPQCSGLSVQRYSAEMLCDRFAKEFQLKRQHHEIHRTPSGVEQAYVYCLFHRIA